MKKSMFIAVIAAFLLGGCAIGVGRHGGLYLAPALPMEVDLDADNYYYNNGYYYWYQGDAWLYSSSRNGPWEHLPRDRYPQHVHYRGGEGGHGGEGDHGGGERR